MAELDGGSARAVGVGLRRVVLGIGLWVGFFLVEAMDLEVS